MNESTINAKSVVTAIFGVLIDPRAYTSTLYSLIAFPLGVMYFVFLVVGFALGLGLVIVWVGLIILALTLLLSFALSWFERSLAILLLGAEVPPIRSGLESEAGLGAGIKSFFINPVTWKGPVFLLAKFPLGIFTFVFAIVGFTVSLAFLTAPIYYRIEPPDLYWGYVDTLPEAVAMSVLGFVGLLVMLHAMKALGWVWGGLASFLLGSSLPGAETPTVPPPAVPSADPDVPTGNGPALEEPQPLGA